MGVTLATAAQMEMLSAETWHVAKFGRSWVIVSSRPRMALGLTVTIYTVSGIWNGQVNAEAAGVLCNSDSLELTLNSAADVNHLLGVNRLFRVDF